MIIERGEMTLRMCTSVAGYMALILTSGLSSEWLSQPSIHAYWTKKGRQRRESLEVWRVERELTMSVVSISLVVAMRPSENEGSAVLSIRRMTGFASLASERSEAVGLSVPSKMMVRAMGSGCRCRECYKLDSAVLTVIQNSLEHESVEFKVHVCEK